MNARRDFSERVAKVQVDWRGIDRICAKNEEKVHLAGIHGLREVADGRVLVDRRRFDWAGVINRRSNIAKQLIEAMPQRVQLGWLTLADDDQTATRMLPKVLHDLG